MTEQYDLVLAGGRLLDPATGTDRVADIGIHAGRVAAIEPGIRVERARRRVDVTGLIVTPGLVDLHAHVFFTGGNPHAIAGDWSVQPDPLAIPSGVTTLVDAGSSGWRNLAIFRATVIERAVTRVLAMVNISGYGMIRDGAEQGDFDPGAVARVHAAHSDVVVGIKSAHYLGEGWDSIDAAVRAGELAGIPVMVDFGRFHRNRTYRELLGSRLRPGDITTHIFHTAVPWVDERTGRLFDYLQDARDRGIRFDLGHGGGGFVFRSAVPAIEQGFYPDAISTDAHGNSVIGPMMDLPTVMSKMLAAGMPLTEVIAASTVRPADTIGRPELGRVTVGGEADLAVFALREGVFGFADTRGGRIDGTWRLECELTLRAGRIVWDRDGRQASDYRALPARYGMRGIDVYDDPDGEP